MGREHGHVLDLGLARPLCLGQLQVAENVVALNGDQNPAGVQVGGELRPGVLGELEQRSQVVSGAGVMLDKDR